MLINIEFVGRLPIRLARQLALIFLAGCLALGLALPARPAQAAEPSSLGQNDTFQKGMSYAAWWSGQYSSSGSDLSMEVLATTGTNWISLIVTGYQDSIQSTAIDFTSPSTPTDQDLIHAINKAHSLGLQVMLKPHVDVRNEIELGIWRGHIGDEYSSEAQWSAWFRSYRQFIGHYAALAEANGVEQFCVGTELLGTTPRASEWRAVVAHIRDIFDGSVTYAALHGGEEISITWWDAVDFIGVDSYYALNEDISLHPTQQELEQAWNEPKAILSQLSLQYGKPIILTEIGYRSHHGCTYHPWSSTAVSPVDLEEQAFAYQAAFSQLYDEPWLKGIFWWTWLPDRFESGACDAGFTPYQKPAEDVIRSWYGGVPASDKPSVYADYDQTLDIYIDQISSSWDNWSWGFAALNPYATDQVMNGTQSMAVTLEPWGALSLQNPELDPTGYYWLEFFLRSSAQDEAQFSVFFESQNGASLPPVPVNDCRHIDDGEIEPNSWQRVRIPLSDLNPHDSEVVRLSIQNTSGGQVSLWIDDVRLVKVSSDAPSQVFLPLLARPN